MQSTFDPAEFVRRIGLDLIRAFSDAREATTPELVGDAMEQPVRDRLEQILPRGIGVGSGCVIDTRGGTSRQMDVVLYEKDLCPVFCINNSPETTYYPAEGVLAVGEVKSRIGKKELAESFEKLRSVKALYRAYERAAELYVGRSYSEYGHISTYGFYHEHTNKGDILGFILTEESSIKNETLLGHCTSNIAELNNDVLCPNIVVFLDGTVWEWMDAGRSRPYTPTRIEPVLPHSVVPHSAESPFGELVQAIWKHHKFGLTAHIPLERYLHYHTRTEPEYVWAAFANVPNQSIAVEGIPETPTDHINNDLQLLGRTQFVQGNTVGGAQ